MLLILVEMRGGNTGQADSGRSRNKMEGKLPIESKARLNLDHGWIQEGRRLKEQKK